jgi:hypothetical protein
VSSIIVNPYSLATGEVAWTTIHTSTLSSDSGGWNNFNLRQWLPDTFYSTSGNQVRLNLEAGSAESATIGGMYIGHAAAAGDAWDFDGTQVQVLVGASGSFVVPAATTIVTDAIDYAFDASKAFIIAMHFNGGTSSDTVRAGSVPLGANVYSKSGTSEVSTSNVTGYATGGNQLRLVKLIEVRTI